MVLVKTWVIIVSWLNQCHACVDLFFLVKCFIYLWILGGSFRADFYFGFVYGCLNSYLIKVCLESDGELFLYLFKHRYVRVKCDLILLTAFHGDLLLVFCAHLNQMLA